MAVSLQQAARFSAQLGAYSAWREDLIAGVRALQNWLVEQELSDAQTEHRIEHLLERLKEDKLQVAFVAEFSRGKSELINAMFFAEFGQRILPSSAGRTTMCPTEILSEAATTPSIRLLPIETRKQSHPLSEWKKYADEWTTIPLDLGSTDSVARALSHVSETLRVNIEEAAELGLHDAEDQLAGTVVPIDGKVEIPRWRHAVINFPHPLLRQGLVILDTPGLNAIGTEPELTLNLLPNAHAVVFILAADTGVTRTDAEIWRDHIATSGLSRRGRLVALNKIDSMWDELKSAGAVEGEVQKQVTVSAGVLGLPESQIFPVSAQKALVAKVNGDAALLARSRLPELEHALARDLIPIKHELVGEACLADLRDITAGLTAILETRARNIVDQHSELTALRGKNEDVVLTMMKKVAAEKEQFEKGLQRFIALRSVFSQHTNELLTSLGIETLKREAKLTRKAMEDAHFTVGLRAAMSGFFANIRTNLMAASNRSAEIHKMMSAMYEKFSEEHGLEPFEPQPYSTLKYQKEVDRLERAYNVHFNTLWNMASNIKFSLMRKFFETVATRIRHVYDVANRDADNWVKAVMAPLETQVREHHLQLRRRLESVKRIHNASNELEARMSELDEMKTTSENQVQELQHLIARVEDVASVQQPQQQQQAPARDAAPAVEVGRHSRGRAA
ncbi:MAG: dynamin family protein [Betaproteobacteria bacterium]|nr:dynamin family protein [Betaproteobacteria bacterium]